MKQTHQFLPQVRFNWGFHDATGEGERSSPARDMTTHFDPFYAAGYMAGRKVWDETRIRPQQSASAWTDYLRATPGAREASAYAEANVLASGYIDEATEKRARELLQK